MSAVAQSDRREYRRLTLGPLVWALRAMSAASVAAAEAAAAAAGEAARLHPCPRGCGEQFRMADASVHEGECRFVQVGCVWGCSEQLQRAQLLAHKQMCPEVRMGCPGCAAVVRRRDFESHAAACDQMPVLCDACDALCLRGGLRAHALVCVALHDQQTSQLPEPTFDCAICLNTQPINNSFQANNCTQDYGTQHRFCFECTAAHAAVKIDLLSEDSPEGEPQVSCPYPGCVATLTMLEVQNLNELTDLNAEGEEIRLSRGKFDKYCRVQAIYSAMQMGATPCPGGCGNATLLPDGSQFFECTSVCKKWFCLNCKASGIPGPQCDHGCEISCDEHRLSINHDGVADRRSALYMRTRTKACPGCDVRIEKKADIAHTCMRMWHPGCRGMFTDEDTRFCWCCLAPHQPIDAHDLSFHKRECLFWTAPSGADQGQHKSNCPNCKRGSAFCDQRPPCSCTRRANGDMSEHTNSFCACMHGCPCDSAMTVAKECTCGGTGPSNNCHCGRNQVTCSACGEARCRLCQRRPHEGHKCVEDRLEGDSAPSDEELEEDGAASSDKSGSRKDSDV
mmetsp:Transcript_902/g.1876  ORF Transcript_902/g.1876 Transcript_902/m.1876 type:complete len:565 (+) Transcript_902:1316-3010(+)